MRNFKKLALVGAFVVTTAFSVTACGSSNGTTQEATTVDSQAEQDSKRAAYREEQSRLAESKAQLLQKQKAQQQKLQSNIN